MKNFLFFLIFFFLIQNSLNASNKESVLEKLNKIENISFNFIQTINGKNIIINKIKRKFFIRGLHVFLHDLPY